MSSTGGQTLPAISQMSQMTDRRRLMQGTQQPMRCVSVPSFATIFAEQEDDDFEPGPGEYTLPSSFGYQHESARLTAPASTLIGRSEAWRKVLVTKAHISDLRGVGTPGAGTYEPKFPHHRTERGNIKFGREERMRGGREDGAPGPIYNMDVPKAPTHTKFKKAQRFSSNRVANPLGPGQYEVNRSTFSTTKAKTFGASPEVWSRVYIPGSEKQFLCRESPGPGKPTHFIANKHSRSVNFTKGQRFSRDRREDEPGPLDYAWIETVSVPRLKSYVSNYRNPPGALFGPPAAKARIDFRKLKKFHNTLWGLL